MYKLISMDDLHLYSGQQALPTLDQIVDFRSLQLSPKSKRMERLCALREKNDKNSALCMAYQLILENSSSANRVWRFLKGHSAISAKDHWRTADSLPHSMDKPTIEDDFAVFRERLRVLTRWRENALGFDACYQLYCLVLEGIIPPLALMHLLVDINSIAKKYGSEATANGIHKLGYELPTAAPKVHSDELSDETFKKILVSRIEDSQGTSATSEVLLKKQAKYHHLALTYKATVTPTGILLRGPDFGVSNRVLRQHSAYTEYFMRVYFTDEDGLSIFHDPRASQENVYSRFRSVLQNGIEVADRKYEFLGFSHSSLHYHAAWFMAPFMHEGRLVRSQDVIKDLGDFTHLHIAAKCAARIGQAFSDTLFAIPLPKNVTVIENCPDIERNGRCFSDGCGTISKTLLKRVWNELPPERRKQQPTVLQIRYKGAKGVVSLDTSLSGEQLRLRKSMIKYEAKEKWRDLELCGAAYKPLTMYLNHQFIKILEDLGIRSQQFLAVLEDEIKALKMMLLHPVNTASFLEYSRSGMAARIPMLLVLLSDIGLPFQADRFLTDMIEVAAMQTLRDLKYRARIPLKKGVLLYGIIDEFNQLKEGEVYVSTRTEGSEGKVEYTVLIKDRVVVTRAPALHPGDVQVVKAVDVPEDSPLKSLYNCVVFSQQGHRDLPSQLGGGDLDGDLFNVIYDERLLPNYTELAADYSPAPPKYLGRPAEREDIIDFFIEYMQSDRLGQISNMHKIKADLVLDGTRHPDCKSLAEMASRAVDFSKSGKPVNMDDAPKGAYHIRPDFMASGPGLVLKDKGFELLEEETEDIDDPDEISLLDPDSSRIRHYRSSKTLGILYRKIDETKFFADMEHRFRDARDAMGSESLMEKLETYIDRETRGIEWTHHRVFAEELRDYYETNMLDIMYSLRPHRGEPLKELEVFSGNILGKKEKASTKAVREANIEVQERFNRDMRSIVDRIVRGDELGDEEDEALPRALACFKIAMEKEGWENFVELQSFKYVAAAVCLEKLWEYMRYRLRTI